MYVTCAGVVIVDLEVVSLGATVADLAVVNSVVEATVGGLVVLNITVVVSVEAAAVGLVVVDVAAVV